MDSAEFADEVGAVAALADPTRRELYLFVVAEPDPVSRDQASEAVGVPRHRSKFHLDQLVEQGLLDVEFRRLSGRQGPGAGRPTKLYRRSSRQLSVTVPERRYEISSHLLAQAIDRSSRSGIPVVEALHAAATEFGNTLGEHARKDMGSRPDLEQLVTAACAALATHGYAPRREGATVTLANCPFDAVARAHTGLVCRMNHVLLDAVTDRLGDGRLTARLDPIGDRCCVVLTIA